MLKNPSYCYKFYWLEGIVNLISEGVEQTTLDVIINEMICSAWYPVQEFHVHLSGVQEDGKVRDALERAILTLSKLSNLPSSASKQEIINEIIKFNTELFAAKEQLTHMVPYRALASFFDNAGQRVDWNSTKRLTPFIEQFSREISALPYTFGPSSKLKKEVYFHSDWIRLIQDNTSSILRWIQHVKVKWLQDNNPDVPGIVYELAPVDEKKRKLGRVRKL